MQDGDAIFAFFYIFKIQKVERLIKIKWKEDSEVSWEEAGICWHCLTDFGTFTLALEQQHRQLQVYVYGLWHNFDLNFYLLFSEGIYEYHFCN